MKITQTKDIRASNRWEIMGLVLRHWPISRADICRRTGLNKATVSTIVKEWLDAGLLRETELGRSEGGRKPILLKPREEAGCTVALDLDIRRVRAILTDLSGEKVLAREQFSIQDPDFPQVYSQLCQGVDRLLKHMPPAATAWWGWGSPSTGWWTSPGSSGSSPGWAGATWTCAPCWRSGTGCRWPSTTTATWPPWPSGS